MSFEAFSNNDIQKMLDHALAVMPKEELEKEIKKYGSEEKYREYLSSGFANEQVTADLIRWYGSKEKAMEAVLQSTGDSKEIKREQEENTAIYKQFAAAKEADNADMAHSAVAMLAKNYKTMFALDNARNILLDLAEEYSSNEALAAITDKQYGAGCAEYIANAIKLYYGM